MDDQASECIVLDRGGGATHSHPRLIGPTHDPGIEAWRSHALSTAALWRLAPEASRGRNRNKLAVSRGKHQPKAVDHRSLSTKSRRKQCTRTHGEARCLSSRLLAASRKGLAWSSVPARTVSCMTGTSYRRVSRKSHEEMDPRSQAQFCAEIEPWSQ